MLIIRMNTLPIREHLQSFNKHGRISMLPWELGYPTMIHLLLLLPLPLPCAQNDCYFYTFNAYHIIKASIACVLRSTFIQQSIGTTCRSTIMDAMGGNCIILAILVIILVIVVLINYRE
jgi:hypothetical protein